VTEEPKPESTSTKEEPQSKKRLKRNAEVIEEETKAAPVKPAEPQASKKPELVVSTEPLKKPEDIALPSSSDFCPVKDSPHHTGQ
jgi:hypothetical protein